MSANVMVVDDEGDLGALLVIFLKRFGYKVYYCENGAVAWNHLKDDAPVDIAIIDVNMPEMDGNELCRKIRSEPRLRGIAILMLTVRDSVEEQVEGYQTGADDYLAKPFEFPVLLARLRALERRVHRAASL
jgi:DNA-binding response OmpR family regulator